MLVPTIVGVALVVVPGQEPPELSRLVAQLEAGNVDHLAVRDVVRCCAGRRGAAALVSKAWPHLEAPERLGLYLAIQQAAWQRAFVDLYVKDLGNADPNLADAAVAGLAAAGTEALPAVLEVCDQNARDEMLLERSAPFENAVRVMASGDASAVPALAEAVAEGGERAVCAADALTRMKGVDISESAPALVGAASSDDVGLRIEAFRALRRVGAAHAAFPAIQEALQGGGADVCVAAELAASLMPESSGLVEAVRSAARESTGWELECLARVVDSMAR